MKKIVSELGNGSTNIALVSGEICDGKTLLLESLCITLSLGRPVYTLRNVYHDILDETASILRISENAVVVVENCFDISEDRLVGLARLFDKSQAALILTSRSIAAEAEIRYVKQFDKLETFRHYKLGRLEETEVDALIDLTDQIAAWRDFWGRTKNEKRSFIDNNCSGSLPSFLLRLMRSEHVREKYRIEYSKVAKLNRNEIHAIIAALYIAHIGHDASLPFLTNVFRYDVGYMVDRLNRKNDTFRLLRRNGNQIRTVPSIGASNILRDIVNPQDLVDAIVKMLSSLSKFVRRDDYTHYLFRQFMRYSILSSVVSDRNQVNRFFDNVSKIEHCRGQVLFWLQWHMAKTDQLEFVDAEKYLRQGYSEAESYERRTDRKYDKKQLDDRKAKFLMIRGRQDISTSSAHFQNFREAVTIVNHLLGNPEVTHHPFETIREIADFLRIRGQEMDGQLLGTAKTMLENVLVKAQRRIQSLEGGYQTRRAKLALESVKEVLKLI